jgi:hypothetical protein
MASDRRRTEMARKRHKPDEEKLMIGPHGVVRGECY